MKLVYKAAINTAIMEYEIYIITIVDEYTSMPYIGEFIGE